MHMNTAMSLAILAASSCATVRIPPERLVDTKATIQGAEENGALGVAAAQLHVQLAKEETETAKHLAARGDERAMLVLARAQADAELALGMTRAASVHADALRAAEEFAR